MAILQLEENRRRGTSAASTHVEPEKDELETSSDTPSPIENHPANAVRVSAEQQWVFDVRGEIDDYMVMLRKLRSLPPDQVFMELSGITARLAELRLTCVRSESRRLVALRTREIDPLIEECDRQFRFHSRIQAVRTMEADMTRGMT